MTNETISAIASLWKLVLILFLLIVVLLFRTQIIVLLNRLAKIHIRKGDTEVIIVQEENKETEKISPQKNTLDESSTPITSEKASADEKEKLLDLNSLSSEELNRVMISAFIENDMNKAEEIFEKLQVNEKDQITQYQNKAFFLYLKFSRGDTNALEKLKQLEETTKSYPVAHSSVYYYIGKCHESVSQYSQAILAFEKAATFAQDEIKKANCIVAIANCHFCLDKKGIAFDVLEQCIRQSTKSEALFTLYMFLSELFNREDNKKMRAIALEKALEFQPNNSSTRFDTAYSYSEAEFKNLSLYHYNTLIRFSPDHSAGLNNLGVVYSDLEMPIHSIKYYKRAWEHKETLAASNLAYKYLNTGFVDEARNILEKAKMEADIHPNVGNAISAISNNEELEVKHEQIISDKAIEQQRFLLNFAENYFTKIPTIEVSGSWIMDGKISDFTQTSTQISASWEEGENKWRFSGTLKNKGAILKFEKWGYNLSKMSKSFIEDGEGYAYFSPDLRTLQVMIVKKYDYHFLTFSRYNQTKEESNNKVKIADTKLVA